MGLLEHCPFPRGTGPLISVLMPTRSRPDSLLKSVQSLHDKSSKKLPVEYLLKVDDDDEETLKILKDLPVDVKVLVGPRGEGYLEIHNWLNQLAAHALGDWFLIWSDDVTMLTEYWDAHIAMPSLNNVPVGMPDGIFAFIIRNVHRPEGHEFFACRREIYEVLGHISQSPCADTQLISVLKVLDRVMYSAVAAEHNNDDRTDQTAEDRRSISNFIVGTHLSMAMTRNRINDCTKLLDYIERTALEKGYVDTRFGLGMPIETDQNKES